MLIKHWWPPQNLPGLSFPDRTETLPTSIVRKILIALARGALVAWAVRLVPGKGIPVGRRRARVYLSGGQAVALGVALLASGAVMAGLAWTRRDADLALVGLCLGWLGALLAFHGRKVR